MAPSFGVPRCTSIGYVVPSIFSPYTCVLAVVVVLIVLVRLHDVTFNWYMLQWDSELKSIIPGQDVGNANKALYRAKCFLLLVATLGLMRVLER